MSLIFATQLTAIATAVLAVFAIITAWYARRAFLKQSQEVRAIEQQVRDAQELTQQQAELLKVQSGQLELQRRQFDEQRQINNAHGEVLELQAREIRASLVQRERETEEEQRRQAKKATAWFGEERHGIWGARIRNDSGLPVLDVRVFFYYIAETLPSGEWEPVLRGAPPEWIPHHPTASGSLLPYPRSDHEHDGQGQRRRLRRRHLVHRRRREPMGTRRSRSAPSSLLTKPGHLLARLPDLLA
jgi:hypothetical protein